MTTNPWPARFLRRSENLLDGTAPSGDPVARLLADAGRLPAGPLSGEDAAVAAFRSSRPADAVAPAAVQTARTLPRSSMRTHALRRLMAAKLLAIGVATATLGGVAFAASFDVIKLPFQPASSTLVAGAGQASRSGAPQQSANADTDGDADNDSPGAQGLAAHPAPSQRPSTAPSAKRDDAKKNDKAKDALAMGQKVRLAVDCQIWKALPTYRNARTDLRTKVTDDLTKAAGGSGNILAFCQKLTGDLCKQWPAPRSGTDAASDPKKRRTLPAQCPFALDHKVFLPKNPGPLPPVPNPPFPVPSVHPMPPVPVPGPASRA